MSLFSFFTSKKKEHPYCFKLHSKQGTIEYYNPFLNFLVYGGMGCGKTASIGKPLLKEYLRHNFAGFIYDFKDMDFTQTAYNLLLHEFKEYPYPFYSINFANPQYSDRTNPISPNVIEDENLFIQLIDDMLKAYVAKGVGASNNDIWTNGALGLFQGVAFRFFKEYPQYCTIPHIVLFCTQKTTKEITDFLRKSTESTGLAGAFLSSEKSEATQASYQSTLANYIAPLSFNKKILYILSGDDFEFNLLDPFNPKLISVSNSFQLDKIISPVVALMLGVSTRQFTMKNKVPCFYLLDEATTFKIADFQNLCSVIREYLCSFCFLTQSSSKIEYLYSVNEKSIIEANFGNHFYGRTTDVRAIEKYPIIFGRRATDRISKTHGATGTGKSSSRTVTSQKENVYDPDFFTNLNTGQFVCSASSANRKKFIAQYNCFSTERAEFPEKRTCVGLEEEIVKNYQQILEEVKYII